MASHGPGTDYVISIRPGQMETVTPVLKLARVAGGAECSGTGLAQLSSLVPMMTALFTWKPQRVKAQFERVQTGVECIKSGEISRYISGGWSWSA